MTMTRPARWNLYTLAENYPEYTVGGSIREKQGGRKSQSQMWYPLDVSLSLAYGLRVWLAFVLSSILSIIKEGDSNMDPPALEGIWGLSNGFIGCWCSVAKVCVCVCVRALSHIWLSATSWTLACQAPLEFPRQECWSELSFPTPVDPPGPGIEPVSLASPPLVGRFFTTTPLGMPISHRFSFPAFFYGNSSHSPEQRGSPFSSWNFFDAVPGHVI